MKINTTTDLMEILYPFQQRAVDFHLSHHYSINGCKMGLGKTIQAIATIAHVDGPACVICPAYLRKNWLMEIDKFLPGGHGHLVTVLSYENFRKYSQDNYKILVLDEAHYIKNMQSKRTNYIHTWVKLNTPEYVLMLTGTPIKNRVIEFFSLMKLCSYNPKNTSGIPLVKGFDTFAKTLCHSRIVPTPYGTAVKYHGLKNKQLLLKYLKGKYFSAKNDKPLPTLNRQEIIVSTQIPIDLAVEMGRDFQANHISTAKQKAAVLKAGATVNYVRDCLENGEKPLLVFSDHIEPCHKIAEGLAKAGYKNTQIITGKVPTDERHRHVVRFQQGAIDVLICTIGSMSTGFTLTATNRVIFNDLSWVPGDNLQAEKRIHRIGQMKDCHVVRLLSEGIDRKIVETLQEKQSTIDKVFSH